MIVTAHSKNELFIHCPKCGKGDHRVDHLAVGTETSWYCDEVGCGQRFHLKRIGTTDFEVWPLYAYKKTVLVTLEAEGPLTLLVKGMVFSEDNGRMESEEEHFERERFYYEEHTCPSNVMGSVVEVRSGNDHDPHGCFRLVKVEPYREVD